MRKYLLLLGLLLLLAGVGYWRAPAIKRFADRFSHSTAVDPGTPFVSKQLIDPHPRTAELSYESKLLRSILLGRSYGLTSADFTAEAIPKDLSYLASQLYSAASTALRHPNCCYPDSAANLQKLLRNAVNPEVVATPADLPAMKTDDLIMIHVYAMVSAGQDQALMQILEDILARGPLDNDGDPKTSTHSHFARMVAVAAMRAYGGPQALQRLSQLATDPQVGALAGVASAMDWSNFYLPRAFAGETPYQQRDRANLLQLASDDSLQTGTILPTMLLGFLAEDASAEQIQNERQYLQKLVFEPNGFLMYRNAYGAGALAFRGYQDFDFWHKAYLANEQVQVAQMQMLRAMVLLDPERFMVIAPQLINPNSGAWVRYEFALAYTLVSQGTQPYSYYDFFFSPPNQYRMRYPFKKEAFAKIDPKPVLQEWASGHWMRDERCPSCDLSWVTMAVPRQHEALFLQGVMKMPKRDLSSYSQIVHVLKDPRGKPVVAYLLNQESDPEIRQHAERYLAAIGTSRRRDQSCCERTQACLISQAQKQASSANEAETVALASATEVESYLKHWQEQGETGTDTAEIKAQISVDDPLAAWVFNDGKGTRWRHYLGCWRPD